LAALLLVLGRLLLLALIGAVVGARAVATKAATFVAAAENQEAQRGNAEKTGENSHK
jgi:hypothetical protein